MDYQNLCMNSLNILQEYEWAIGTDVGGQQIQRFTSTGAQSVGINTNLKGLLEHNTTYYVSVKCQNEAGLTTLYEDARGNK